GLAKLRSAAARIRDYGSGDIRLACLSAFSTNLIPHAIANFRKKHPHVAISLHVAGSSAIRDMVAAHQIDIAVTADEIDVSGVEAAPCAEVAASVARPPGRRLAAVDVSVPQHLRRVPFSALSPEDTRRREAEAILLNRGVRR